MCVCVCSFSISSATLLASLSVDHVDFNNFSFIAYCLVFFSHSPSGMVLLGLGHRQITAELGQCYTPGLGVWTCTDVLLLASGTVVLSCCRQTGVVGFQWWPQRATGTQLRKGHSLAVETSFTCILSCTFPKSNKGHINSSLCYCCGKYIQNTHYFKKYFVAQYADSHYFPLCFGKKWSFPVKVFAVQKGKKPNTEAIVNSAADCNSASKYHSCRLWMFCPYHQELTLQPVSSFLALEESINYSQS